MTPRRESVRIYTRERGGERRYYGDFRAWADAGGRQEPLVASGEKLATTNPRVARRLADKRADELDTLRQDRALHGRRGRATLADFAARHLVKKKQAGRVTQAWLELSETFLLRAVEYFGAERPLDAIGVEHVEAWATHLATLTTRSKRPLSAGTVRHHLNVLSGLYRRARAEQLVPSGYDPVGDMIEKPIGRAREAHFLEVPDAALILEAARTLPRAGEVRAEYAYPLIATFLLSGGRRAEVLPGDRGYLLRSEHGDIPTECLSAALQDNRISARGAALATAVGHPPRVPERADGGYGVKRRAGQHAPLSIVPNRQ